MEEEEAKYPPVPPAYRGNLYDSESPKNVTTLKRRRLF